MPLSYAASSVYSFGVFELDGRTGELRRDGVKLKLQDQLFQVLLRLLGRPGEIVSRDELRSALWSDDTFVDFDTGLNTTIKHILHAFGASNLANELYNSNQAGNRDRFGAASHFGTPMIVNGKVYLGTTKGIAVFGLLKR